MGSIWTLEDAREKLTAVVEAARNGEPQRVCVEGDEAVVVVSVRDYELMSKRPKTLNEHLANFPKLPDDAQDLFDKRNPEALEFAPREIDWD
ncbi:type II toxin-antitoxin system prevent-host-death family antitoxin [Aureimonas psammosilenae]|uniref:type II toxin-antitoxin system prevent-host-death family antitoxin n=1 Tax=Aureimonas psammosilenae TaxID=2495496 RepID=UPI001260F030|nr:type II toxin-antitoxin system prevent-host-death family antitoxin [Aureimonas psammosilenae]